jgi:hypothetical protein
LFEFSKVAVVFLHHRVTVDNEGMATKMIIKCEGLAIVERQTGGIKRIALSSAIMQTLDKVIELSVDE